MYALERPGTDWSTIWSRPKQDGLHFPGQAEAIDWLFTESACFLACARQLGHGSTLRRAVDLLMAAGALGESGANIRQYEQTAQALKEAADADGNAYAEARARSVRTGLHLTTGNFAAADEEASVAGALGAAEGDPISSSYALNDRGIVANYQGRHLEAKHYLGQALEAFRAQRNQIAEASALCNLSRASTELGETAEAIALAEQALAIHSRLGVSMRRATTLYALGIALVNADRLLQAERHFGEALEIFQNSRQRLWEGMVYFRLGEVQLAAEQPAQAAMLAEQAIVILRSVGGPWRRANALTLLGRALEAISQHRRAHKRAGERRWTSTRFCVHPRSPRFVSCWPRTLRVAVHRVHNETFIDRLSPPGMLLAVDPAPRGAGGSNRGNRSTPDRMNGPYRPVRRPTGEPLDGHCPQSTEEGKPP